MRLILFLIVYFTVMACQTTDKNIPGIIPLPDYFNYTRGSFTISGETSLYAEGEEALVIGKFLAGSLERVNQIKLSTGELKGNSIKLLLLDDPGLGNEGYRLEISPDQIAIQAHTPAGLFYGVQSLIQLCGTEQRGEVKLPGILIEDQPRFAWRGMHLDESRHFHGKEHVKKFIDMLVMHKLNVFHWHLTDDQGWRIEINQYPKLTSIGAWREDRRGEIWNIDNDQRQPYPEGKPYYGGYYTQDEIREIVQYASERYITIVPEIEMPGHSLAALVAYPEYSCFGLETKVASGGFVGEKWDFSDPYCAGKEETFEFLQNILDEVMELFPSEYIHIGGDECSKNRWSQCSLCQKRIRNENLKDEYELQSYFIQRIEKYVSQKGRRIIGWQEILEGGMNPSAAIMPWRGASALEVAFEAAQGGHEVIMAPSDYLYFNRNWPGDSPVEQDLSLEDVYNYEPIPSGLGEEFHTAIIGLQACIWGEHTPTWADVEYQIMPRLAALAETGWTGKELKNTENFLRRLESLKPFYRLMDMNYFVQKPSGLPGKTIFTEKAEVSLKSPSEDYDVYLTLDGSDPGKESVLYNKPFEINKTTQVNVVAIDLHGKKSKVVSGIFEKQDFLAPVEKSKNEVSPGLQYIFFEQRFRSAYELDEAKGGKHGITQIIEIVSETGESDSGTIFSGYIEVPVKGIYTFHMASNDGSLLWIGHRLVIDNDGFTSARNRSENYAYKSGQVALDAGIHPIRILYFDWGGGEEIKVLFSAPGIEQQDITGEMLFH